PPLDRAAKAVAAAPYSRFPVYQESYDDIIGFVHVRDLLNPDLAGRPVPVGEVCRPVKQLPTSKRVLSALSEMRRDRAHMAIVVDEYGGTATATSSPWPGWTVGASPGSGWAGWASRMPMARRAGRPPARRRARRPSARRPARSPPRLQVVPPLRAGAQEPGKATWCTPT